MKKVLALTLVWFLLAGCAATTQAPQATETTPAPDPTATDTAETFLPNPAAVYCVEQGFQSEIRTAADGSQFGVCIFPDGSECDEWAYYRGKCALAAQSTQESEPTGELPKPTPLPTAIPVDQAGYDGWETYVHPVYKFSLMIPEDWVVEDPGPVGSTLYGHILFIKPEDGVADIGIRLTFRQVGDDLLLWPTGVGQGEFIRQGTLDVAGEPADRVLLVCPSGEITSIRYHGSEDRLNILRGEMEFAFLYNASDMHCQPGFSLGGKVQWVGEMIIASLKSP